MPINIKLMESASETEGPSRFLANIFLLLGIAALVLSGQMAESTLAQYLIGSVVEVLLALLAVGFVKLNKLSIRRTMRLKWPGLQPLILCAVAAPGLWMIGVAINITSSVIFGYTTPTPPQMYPTNLWESLSFIFSAVIIAPICEELMFRGYVQRAYDRGKPIMGILIGGLIFALYHMQFQGLFALLPVAITLGFVAWRTESILPGMILHAAYNMIASTILITSTFFPYHIATALLVTLIVLGVVGIAVMLVALWIMWRSTNPQPLHPPRIRSGYIRWVWVVPLFLLALIYIYGSLNEVIAGRFPEILAVESLDFQAQPAWKDKQTWDYEIQDIIGGKLGSAQCILSPNKTDYTLSCSAEYEASNLTETIPLDIPWLSRKINVEEGEWQREVTWEDENLDILELSGYQRSANHEFTLAKGIGSQTLLVDNLNDGSNEFEITADALISGEWPWRLSGLPMELFYGSTTSMVTLDDEGNLYIVEAFVSVRSAEPAWTPAGSFVTWKITVSYKDSAGRAVNETAWYDTTPPHPLIRYDSSHVNYIINTLQYQDK